MSKGINRVIILGRLGKDPDVRYTASGSAITNISIATSDSWKDKATGQQQERTEWHRVVFWGKLAEIAGQYLKKGSQVYIEGSLRTNKYTDKQGVERYSTDINATELQMLGGGNSGGGNDGFDQRPQQSGYNQPKQSGFNQPQNGGRPADNLTDSDFDRFDDNVPF